jgi:hypothetical protein
MTGFPWPGWSALLLGALAARVFVRGLRPPGASAGTADGSPAAGEPFPGGVGGQARQTRFNPAPPGRSPATTLSDRANGVRGYPRALGHQPLRRGHKAHIETGRRPTHYTANAAI